MMDRSFLDPCEDIIRMYSSTFYKAFRFLASPQREAVYVTYAFCRMIDDSVDEPERSSYTVAELEANLRSLETADGHFIWPALRWLFRSFPVTPEPFYRQMEGQRMDLSLNRYNTFEELERYCYLVAGTVGEMLVPILQGDPAGRETVESAVQLGKAMQIVNIIRDVGEDQRRGRRYIPLELMQRYGYSETEFEHGQVTQGFCDTVDWMMTVARQWMLQGLLGLQDYPVSSAFCMELAAHSYMAILDEVVHNQYEVFTKRAMVNPSKKLAILHKTVRRYPHLTEEAANHAVL
ncbi:phytoene/squalene synthase family protein [Paenibacillus mesotrionivorans]|uniref:Phytoene/squalene synthase family protein n=1 Tax=Paenibacillus mesotrionivorans TaxID=3160968 RepID=A0ACC7NXK1_9BACL